MAKVRSWAGLDVHAATVVAVTVDGESGELRAQRLAGETAEVVAFCAGLPGPTRWLMTSKQAQSTVERQMRGP
jgi:hypothetical protein